MIANQLQRLQTLLRTPSTTAKDFQTCLHEISLRNITLKHLQQYHHLLLYSLAYPIDIAFYEASLSAYREFMKHCYNITKKKHLYNVQLPGSDVIANFSLEFIREFVVHQPDIITFDNCPADKLTQSSIIQTILFGCEKERFESELFSLKEWFEQHRITQHEKLDFLMSRFDQSFCKAYAREYLFDQLQIQVRLKNCDGAFFNDSLRPDKVYISISPKYDLNDRINLKELKPSSSKQENIIRNSRLVLAAGFRETDPITHANDVRHIITPSGFDIMLFSMNPDRRLALESYIGYMVYRNGVACAYGGGWIFLHQCKIGISIFPYLRGGASSELFTELMRVYKQLFNIKIFTVEPYQFGRNNKDGINSGAFWFYYKHGFRPVNEKLFQLAEKEWQKISANKSYRSGKKVLKQLATGDIQLKCDDNYHRVFIHPYLINKLCTTCYEKYNCTDIGFEGFLLNKNHSNGLNPFAKERSENNYTPLYTTVAFAGYNSIEENNIKNWIYEKVYGDEYKAIKYQQKLHSLFKRITSLQV